MDRLEKIRVRADVQPEVFQGKVCVCVCRRGGGVVEMWQVDKDFIKNIRKKVPAGKQFGVEFFLLLLNLHFEWRP